MSSVDLKPAQFEKKFMLRAVELSKQNLSTQAGGPFGAVIVRNGQIISEGSNQVLKSFDPTAHAEVVAIRNASNALQTFDLSDCEIYTSCEPCPMCLAAIYWARLKVIFYGNSRKDAAKINFDDDFIYQEIPKPLDQRKIPIYQRCEIESLEVFRQWEQNPNRQLY